MEESEYFLLKIRRQALDSPIIRLSMDIREGKRIKYGKYDKGVFKISSDDLDENLLLKSDQLICGKNKTRNFLNKRMRKMLGYNNSLMPYENEKIIGLNNHPDKGLYNGQVWLSQSDYSEYSLKESNRTVMAIKEEGSEYKQIIHCWFPDDLKAKSFATTAQLANFCKDNSIYLVDFGYAITAHKCLTADTMILSNKGMQRLIDLDNGANINEFKPLENIKVFDGSKMADVDSFYNNGEDHVWKITTKKGFVLNATKDHNVLTFDGNSSEYLKDKTTKDLQVGDNVLIPMNMQSFPDSYVNLDFCPNLDLDIRSDIFELPTILDEDLGALLGLLTADGFVDRKRIHYTKASYNLCTYVKDLMTKIFKLPENKISIKKSNSFEFYIVALNSVCIATFMQNFIGLQSNNKTIDPLILRSPKSVQALYLKGLFEDGYVNVKAGKFNHIELVMKQYELFKAVQLMLCNFGIMSSHYLHKRKSGNLHAVMIYSLNAQKFYNEIGFYDEEKTKKLETSFNIKNKYGTEGFNLSTILRSLLSDLGMSSTISKTSPKIEVTPNGGVSLNLLEAALNKIQNTIDAEFYETDDRYLFLIEIMNRSYYLDSIKSIEYIGKQPTYCLRMKDAEHPYFLQNGIYGGNSQGSSYKRPIVFEEYLGDKDFHKKWLYTAVTRAVDKLIIVT